jgi:hypothetical protein
MENTTTPHPLADQLWKGAAAFLKHEQTHDGSIVDGLDIYGKISEDEDQFNAVSLVFIQANPNNKGLKDTLLHAITSIIGSNYKKEHLHFLEEKAQTEKTDQGIHALDFYLRLGSYHESLRPQVIDFVVNYYTTFSSEQLNLTGFYLYNVYPKTQEYFSLFQTIVNFHKGITPEKNENPMGYLEPETKPWWKFW